MDWRDYISLTAIVFVVVIAAAVLLHVPAAQLSDWRPATVLLAIMALIIFFALSPLFAPIRQPESITAALLGLSALLLTFVGMIISNQIIFLLLCVNLVALWSVVAYNHIQATKNNHAHR